MESTIMETVLKEVLEEQKLTNELHQEQTGKMEELIKKVEAYDQKLEQVKVIAPPVDTVPIQKIMDSGLQKITQVVAGQPKNVIRQVRLLLFPETNSDRYYRLIFGRLIPWAGLFLTIIFLIPVGRQYIASRTELQQRRYYFEVYREAWERLDTTVDLAARLKMRRALQKAVNHHRGEE